MSGFILFLLGICGSVLWAFLTILFAAFVIGAFRLFILGVMKQYDEGLKDPSVLQKGDILLTGKQSVGYSWYIQLSNVLTRKIKHRFWTHAAIYKGDGKVVEAQPEGVIEKDVQDYFKDGFMVRAFRHQYVEEDATLNRVIEFCADKKGFHFGKVGLIFYFFSTLSPISFNFLFDNKWIDKWCHLDEAYFCSELIVDAFDHVDRPISPYDGWRVKPTDFIGNPFFVSVPTSSTTERKEVTHAPATVGSPESNQ